MAPIPVRCPGTRSRFLANASRPFITSCPVWKARRHAGASPALRRVAAGKSEPSADSLAASTGGAAADQFATVDAAAAVSAALAKKHRRVIGSVAEVIMD